MVGVGVGGVGQRLLSTLPTVFSEALSRIEKGSWGRGAASKILVLQDGTYRRCHFMTSGG